MKLIRILSLLAFALLVVAPHQHAFGQLQSGAIAGTVADPTGAALTGAKISIESQDIHVVSNDQGRFFISGIAPGQYRLTISYLGFATQQKQVTVSPGQTATLAAYMELVSQKQTVVVTAPRVSGEAEALNEERTADNILQVLPSEVIRSLPNANMADALGRMPSVTLERDEGEGKYVQVRSTEPRLTNTTVDGVNLPSQEPGVRQIKFDAIPADIVESVQVSKTLQANMDGDGIGGSVNLVTKSATDAPTLNLGSMGGYTPISNGRGETEETATLGKRFGAGKKFGILVGGSYDWNGRVIDDIEPVPDIATLSDGSTMQWKDDMDIRPYVYFRSRWGLAGSADYRIREGSNVYLRYLYSDFKNYGNRYAWSFTDNTPGLQLLAPGNTGCATDANGVTTQPCTAAPSFNTQLRHPDINVGSLIVGGTHVLSSTWYSWELAASRGSYGSSPYTTASFDSNLSSSACQYAPQATTHEYLPQWNAACYAEAYNPGNLSLSAIHRDLGHSAQLNLEASGSGAWRYHLGNKVATLEYGGKLRNDHKFADTYVLTLTPNGDIPLSTFPSRYSDTHFYKGGDYKLGYAPNAMDVLNYANQNSTLFTSDSTQGQDPSQFDLVEKVSTGYVMNTLDMTNRVRFIVGLRAEVTKDNVDNLAFGSDGSITPNHYSGSYYNLLPSVAARFGVGTNSYLRLVYARGLSRPDPQDIAQPLSWTDTGNGANRYSVSFGNANLKAETGDDLDVLFDHYFETFGAVSAGYFYKSLHDPIISSTFQLVNYQPPGGPQGNYLATQPVNAGSASLSGFEASFLQHFTALPGALGGLGLSANYGYTTSSTNGIPGRSDHPTLLRNSPNAFNLSPTYDYRRVSLRLGMTYNQASIYSYQYGDGTPGGVNGPLSDIWFYTHFQTDAQGSVRLGRGMNLIVSGLNLNNEVFGFYQGSPQYMIQREYYQPTFSAGIRWSPARGEH